MTTTRAGILMIGLCLGGVLPGVLTGARADRIWWDGTRDAENAAPGKLLSDNGGYWGERIVTGVEYSYEAAPDNPADTGRRLLDGVPAGDWNVPIGAANRPIVAIFDFKRACTFNEVDISTRSQKAAFKIECGDKAEGPWRVAFERTREDAPDKMFHRLTLPARPTGRFLRLTVNAVAPQLNQWLTFLEEVVVWGDAEVSKDAPEVIQPIAPTPVITGVAFPSIPGIPRTTFSDSEFNKWRLDIGAAAKLAAVWSTAPTWDSITDRPLLPVAAKIAAPLRLTMARNETECAAFALTNTLMIEPSSGEVALSSFRRIGAKSGAVPTNLKGVLRVAGAINSRNHGPVVGPLFEADNKPGTSLLRRYLTNTEGIKDFPRLTLTPAGSAVLWLEVETQGAAPGLYSAQLSFRKTPGSPPSVQPVQVQVLDVTLPKPLVWLSTWDHATGMFPFAYADRMAREVAHKQSIGMTVWNHLPTPGSEAALARAHGKVISHVRLVPSDYVNRGFNNQLKPADIGDKDKAAIADHVRALVKQTQDLGLGYDDWFGEMWDEPGRGNAEIYGVLARIVREVDPKVRIYANPIFWEGTAPAPDEVISTMLGPWYRQNVDVSVPHELLLRGYPKSEPLFDAPHVVRASYRVSTHGDKNERAATVDSYRRQGWDAFARGYNGWGFYSYYSPVGDPWNDFDGDNPDYIMVYPGPRGPIPTRTSENVREGWEDYRLLSLLKARGLKTELDGLLKSYAKGETPQTLRLRALQIAAAPRKSPSRRTNNRRAAQITAAPHK